MTLAPSQSDTRELENWVHALELSSIPLQKLGQNLLPEDFASGCLGEYRSVRFLLTVHHAVSKGGNWAMAIRFVPEQGMELYQLGAMTLLQRIKLKTMTIDDVEFAFTTVPKDPQPKWELFNQNTLKMIRTEFRTVHQLDFESMPKREIWYGFSGHTNPELEYHSWLGMKQPILGTKATVVPVLKYVADEEDMHVFEIAGDHPGHEHFKGCSGAPIIDQEGNVVALVCDGCVERKIVRGVSLKAYRSAVEVELLQRTNP